MKIYHFSDTHTRHNELIVPKKDFDVVIFSGDESNNINPYFNESEFLDFFDWFVNKEEFKGKHKIFVPGNHSTYISSFESEIRELFADNNIYLLINQSIIIDGKVFYGSPLTPTFGRWVYMKDEAKIQKIYEATIPSNVDVIISHGPAYGTLDRILGYQMSEKHIGSKALECVVNSLHINNKPYFYNLKAVLFGHIHSNKHFNNATVVKNDNIIYSNAAFVNDDSYNKLYHGNIIEI